MSNNTPAIVAFFVGIGVSFRLLKKNIIPVMMMTTKRKRKK